jgi:hypothetical protein
MGRTHTKTVVVVEVVDVVVVAIRATGVRFIIVERTTTQHTAFSASPVIKDDKGIIQPIFHKRPAFGGRKGLTSHNHVE